MTLQPTELLPTQTYSFQKLRYLLSQLGIKTGVIGPTDYLVAQRAAGANYSVDVAAGDAWVLGTDATRQGIYHQVNDATINVASFTAAHGTLPRIDMVVLQINDSSIVGGSDTPTLSVVTGTATSGATLDNRTGAGTVPNGALWLADVLIPATSTSIVTANIRDQRAFARPVSSAGKCIVPGTDTRTNVAFGTMPTPDQVSITLPTDGLIKVMYQAMWQESVLGAAKAAIFIGANQLKIQASASTTRATNFEDAVTGGVNASQDGPLMSFNGGLAGLGGNAVGTADVTTGQVVGGASADASGAAKWTLGGAALSSGANAVLGGPCFIFAAAGTYVISIQFKASSGSVIVKNRKLWVTTEGY